jgi:hypothetical protein
MEISTVMYDLYPQHLIFKGSKSFLMDFKKYLDSFFALLENCFLLFPVKRKFVSGMKILQNPFNLQNSRLIFHIFWISFFLKNFF